MSFMDDLKSGKYNFTVNGECIQCGRCCGNILPIGDKDIQRIKKYIELNHVKECKHFHPTSKPVDDNICPFRDNNRKICTIYPARPEICKDYICSLPQSGQGLDLPKYRSQNTRLVSMRDVFFGKQK